MVRFYLTHFSLVLCFYLECYTGLIWLKGKYSLTQTLNLVPENVSEEVSLTGPKVLSPSADWVLVEG